MNRRVSMLSTQAITTLFTAMLQPNRRGTVSMSTLLFSRRQALAAGLDIEREIGAFDDRLAGAVKRLVLGREAAACAQREAER